MQDLKKKPGFGDWSGEGLRCIGRFEEETWCGEGMSDTLQDWCLEKQANSRNKTW